MFADQIKQKTVDKIDKLFEISAVTHSRSEEFEPQAVYLHVSTF